MSKDFSLIRLAIKKEHSQEPLLSTTPWRACQATITDQEPSRRVGLAMTGEKLARGDGPEKTTGQGECPWPVSCGAV